MRNTFACAISLALLATLASCSDDTTIPPRGDASTSRDGATGTDGSTGNDGGGNPDARLPDGGPNNGACATTCTQAEFCEKPTCNATSGGSCVLRPSGICNTIAMPQCGCDGVTYGNECNRRSAGVSKAHDGACACSMVAPMGCCFTAGDCRNGARCVGATCTTGSAGVCVPPPTTGTCWIDSDCTVGTCQGASICGCAQLCLLPDRPGTCQP